MCYEERRIIEACLIKGDKECEIDMMKDLSTKINNDHDRIFSTQVPETSAVAPVCQCETEETEGVGEEPKVEKNTCDEERTMKLARSRR